MLFEWDEHKNELNKLKHGFDFKDVITIFSDPNRVELIDSRNDYGEIRYRTIGMVNDILLLVIYTLRDNHYRIISARRARKDERKNYYI